MYYPLYCGSRVSILAFYAGQVWLFRLCITLDGKPRIVHQAYLGSAEKLAELVQQNTAPIPLSATLRNFGLPGALWLAAKQSGLWLLLESLWPAPRSGPAPAHYLLL